MEGMEEMEEMELKGRNGRAVVKMKKSHCCGKALQKNGRAMCSAIVAWNGACWACT
jgi:hypothetical protein